MVWVFRVCSVVKKLTTSLGEPVPSQLWWRYFVRLYGDPAMSMKGKWCLELPSLIVRCFRLLLDASIQLFTVVLCL